MKFNQVDKAFGHNVVLRQFSHDFTAGKHCIIGPNGCGKTTLLMLAAGLEAPCGGTIDFAGLPVASTEAKRLLGIASDKIALPRFLTAWQLLEFHCGCYGVSWPKQLINDLHFNTHLATAVSELSLGNQKKLSLLLALSHQPKCLLLDEPSTGLDSDSRAFVAALLNDYSGTVIITSHDPLFTENSQYQPLSLSAS